MSKETHPRDISMWEDEEITEAFEDNPKEFLATYGNQILYEDRVRRGEIHPVPIDQDDEVLDLVGEDGDRNAHGGRDSVIARRLKQGARVKLDPYAAGDCRRTVPEDVDFNIGRLRRKFNVE